MPIRVSGVELLVIKKLLRDMNVDISGYKDDFLSRRIMARMMKLKVNSIAEYIRILKHSEEERLNLLNELAINVSCFFRDPPVWQVVKQQVLIPLFKIAAESGRTVRIWSAGCAYGQEPYTIAILSMELIKSKFPNLKVIIYATDIDEDALSIAEKGIYGISDLKDVPCNLLTKYFNPVGGNLYEIKPYVKQLVRFRRHDLLKDRPIPLVNAIFCRNVLIYFRKTTRIHVLKKFYESLIRPGFLILGMSESLPTTLNNMFKPISLKYRIYLKN